MICYFVGKRARQREATSFREDWTGNSWRPTGWGIPSTGGMASSSIFRKRSSLSPRRELGLLLPKRREGWYDVFRGRIIFPIFDIHQRVIGFGGRVINEGHPKYLNSSESTLYHKGETLYGLHIAKPSIAEKDSVIIVEGYFDLLTLHQYGFKNSVATLGTALTPQHIRVLKRYTRNFITLFDGDQAGIRANLRTLPLFLEEEVWPKTISSAGRRGS